MKKLIFFLTVIFSAHLLMAENYYEISFDRSEDNVVNLTFNLNEYRLSSVTYDGVTYSKILFNSVVTNRKGYAELPYVGTAIQLVSDKNVDLIIRGYEYEDYDLQYLLLPSRGVIYRDQDPSSVPYVTDPGSVTDTWYPSEIAYCTDPFIIRDIRGASVYFYPFQYNAAKNILRIIKSISVELVENESPSINPLNREVSSVLLEMDEIYRSVFINYEQNREDLSIWEYGDILVITVSEYEQAVAPYIQWKKEKGYKIFKEVVAQGTNVKTLIQEEFNENNDLLYVLLAGDWDNIQSDLGTSSDYPMDPQLGCVIGSDHYADICIGRFSASTASQITVQVNKTIQYEKDPDMDGTWYNATLGIGSSEGAGSGDDGEMDKEHLDIIYNDKMEPFTYDTYYTAHDPGSSASAVLTTVNNGVSLINYTGHGGSTSWVTSGFSNSNVNSLSNGEKLPFIISVACNNGQFHDTECFAEAWLKKEDGGAIVALMSTISQPWQPPMRGQDYMMDVLIRGYNYDDHPGQNGINTSDQRTTIGSIIFNGLVLMYMESNTTSDLETMQTWTTFGDPSIQMRTDTPSDLTLSNETVMAGIPFETVVNTMQWPFEGALVCISQDNNYYSGITNESGNVTITHTLNPGPALFVITGFNLETIYRMIDVVSADGPWITFSGHTLDDQTGNNNGLADYSESITLDVEIKNVGVETANNVSAAISASNSYVTVTDSDQDFGDIAVDAVAEEENAYGFSVAGYVPDQENVVFILDITDGTDNWQGQFSVLLNAPDLNIEYNYIDDNTGGDGNGFLDPGETVDIYINAINNGHAATVNSEINLSTTSDYLTINTLDVNTGILDTGSVTPASFGIFVDELTPVGVYVDLIFTLTAGEYSTVKTIDMPVGLIIEDWETGGFNSYNWEQDGDTPWIITDIGQYEGAYCAQSGDINNNETSVLEIIMDVLVNDTIKFYKKVSCEDGHNDDYDYLAFEIDASEMGRWDGEADWSVESYPVLTGEHTFTWRYVKDYSLSTGSDCAWIDYIKLPAHESSYYINYTDKNIEDIQLQVFPNPANRYGTIFFSIPGSATIQLSLIDLLGEEVKNIINNKSMSRGEYYVNFNSGSLRSGIYFCRLTVDDKTYTRKLIIDAL